MTDTVSLTTDALDGVSWAVLGATIETGLNAPYLVQLDIETDRLDVDPLELLGSGAELTLEAGGQVNVYAGVVSSARRSNTDHTGWVRGRITIEPALCALQHGRDSRIFQDLSVPDILAAVLSEGLAPYGRSARQLLDRSYPVREYTVQYEESLFDFVHRLMEEEGILYQFEQDGGAETMVLLDSATSYDPIAGNPLLEYSDTGGAAGRHSQQYIRMFDPISGVRGTEVSIRRFDWTHPSALITAANASGDSGELPNGAVSGPARQSYEHDVPGTLYAFGGAYGANDASDQARIRRECQARDAARNQGWSTVAMARAGARFDLNAHPNLSLNAAYVFIEVTHYIGSHAVREALLGEGPKGEDVRYFNRFVAVSADVAYRPERVHPHPRIDGIQTAIVTGPPGEEIHTDEHGRIKVQFHWDRLGGMDDRTTCWIRVMQTWAGGGFGAFVLPRVGMEVVVSFVDGDPDHPLVTGCVYNGANAGPYETPAKKMQSGFKTNSYPGGGGFNELRFDDSKSEEEVWLQAEKDWNTLVKNDLTRDVLHDETQHVEHDRTRTVGNDEDLWVKHDRDRRVANDESVTVNRNRTKTVKINETLNVGVNRVRNVGAVETVTIGGIQNILVGGVQNISVGMSQNETVAADRKTSVGAQDQLNVAGAQVISVVRDQTSQVGGSMKLRVGGDANYKVDGSLKDVVKGSRSRKVSKTESVTVMINQMITVGLARQVTVGGAYNVTVAGLMHVVAGISHEIVCGDSSIKLEKDGKITIKGKEITIAGEDKVIVTGGLITLN